MKRLLVLLALCALALPASAALPKPSGAAFAKGAVFTVAGYAGSSLADFPVLVRLAEGFPAGFSYNDVTNAASAEKRDVDLAFTDMLGGGLPFEIDTWNPQGTSLVWVTLPTMAAGTQFAMFYGSESSGTNVCSATPWSGYVGVWHMNETTNGVTTIRDSTTNALDGTCVTSSSSKADGVVGRARFITSNTANAAGNPYDSGVTVDMTGDQAKLDAVNGIVPEFSASFWVRPQVNANWWYFITRKTADKGKGWGFQQGASGDFTKYRAYGGDENDTACLALSGVTGLAQGTWTKIDAVWMADKTFKLYVNGNVNNVYEGTLKNAASNGTQSKLALGGALAPTANDQKSGRGVYGDMDEIRLRADAATPDRIAADYATQTSPSFLSCSGVEDYVENNDPVAVVSVDSFFYTNATVSATVADLGGAPEAGVTVQIAETSDFAAPVWTTNYAVAVPGSRSFDVIGLATGTTHYVRLAATNALGGSAESGPFSFTTFSPVAPSGTAAFFSRGFTTLAATATASDIGTGAQSATIRLEASTDGFTNVVASTEVSAVVDQTETLVAGNLTPGVAYRLRVRIRNDWGLATYIDLPDATTYAVPFAVTGIGWTFSPDGSTVDFSFGVSAVFDGATGTATLEYDGRTFSTQEFSSAGSLVWPNVAAAAGTATATVTVSADVDGTTYTHVWTAAVAPGSTAYAMSALSDLAGTFFRAGDAATLPELSGLDYYVVMDVRSFSLGADGVTLTALEPGFSAVVSLAWDANAAAYAVSDRALAVCIPEVQGAGRVFFAKPGAKMNWEDSSKWTNVTDPTAEADCPHLAGDVAMAALPDNQLVLNGNATVAELYVGPDENHMHTGLQRLTGKNAATLTFARPSGKPGFLRFTGMFRTDTPALTNGWNQYAVGGGDGNSTSTGLGIEMPGGLEFDCGAWPDYTDTALRNTFGRARYFVNANMRFWNIPEGKTLRIFNTTGRKQTGDSQDGNHNFLWENGSQVTGKGTFFYDAAASFLSKGMFRAFEGVVEVANKQAYDTFPPSDRGGGFKFRPELYSSASAQVAEDATLLLEGDANGSEFKTSFCVVNAGHTHGYGSWGRAINAYPAKKWILDGGYVYQTHNASTEVTWREDGTTATQPVCTPNGAGTLCVSNGFNYVKLSQSDTASVPTNSLAFGTLEHAGDGVLLVRSDRLYYSYDKNGGGSGWRDRTVLGGFHDLAVGGTGRAVVRHGDATVRTNYLEATAPIVPWIVASLQSDSSLFFPGADDETDELVLAGYPKISVLDEVSDPTANVRADGKTIALSADRTVNSLVLANNRNAGKNLGAGRTLTITSGGLVMGNGNYKNTAYIGDESGYNAGTAGTLVFPNKAYVFVPVIRDDKNEHPEIWAQVVSPNGAVFSYPGDLHLGGDQTGIDDHIAVNGTDLRLGTETTGCQIDVPVHLHGAFARLRIGKQGSFCRQDLHFWDHRTTGSKFEAVAGTEEPVHKLFVDGASMPRGYYGSSDAEAAMSAVASGAFPAFVDDNHFAGTGYVKVFTDELLQPTMLILY